MIKTSREALAFVRRYGVVTMTRSEKRPSLVDAVAGERVRGSWWGHAKGALIYKVAESLHDSKTVLSTRLIEGKVTFIDRRLWSALACLVMDGDRRAGLSPPARLLLERVERRGTVTLDGKTPKRAREELERSWLVHSGSVHTERGSHATVLTAWRRIFGTKTRNESRRMSVREARVSLGLG